MVLISFKTSHGHGGRCDEKCHSAKEPKCVCICGGKNHGVGLNQAIQNTEKIMTEDLQMTGLEPREKIIYISKLIPKRQGNLFV